VLKRLGVLAAILALLGAGVSNARAQNKNRNLVVMTRNMDTGSDYKFVLTKCRDSIGSSTGSGGNLQRNLGQ